MLNKIFGMEAVTLHPSIFLTFSKCVFRVLQKCDWVGTRALKSAVFHQRLAGSWQPLQRLSGSAAEPLEPLAAKRLLSGSASIFLDFAVQIFCVFKKIIVRKTPGKN